MPVAIRLATRASPLALWQAREVAARLRRVRPGLRVQLVPVVASGDQDHATPLYHMGGIGVFAKEVHQAVLDGRADAGVHSCKDLPTQEPAGLVLAAILPRADPRDALIGAASLDALPAQAVIGTSSLRRQAQLQALRGDLRFASIRGNVATRLRIVAAGTVAATIMAMAGLRRLGLARSAGAVPLDPWHSCTPAPGQGAIAVDCRSTDRRTRLLCAAIDDAESHRAIVIERQVLSGLQGGCSLPLGCYARCRHGIWHLRVRLAQADGRLRELSLQGPATQLARRALDLLGAVERPAGAARPGQAPG
jgi:hydroxymethylbilane synthase